MSITGAEREVTGFAGSSCAGRRRAGASRRGETPARLLGRRETLLERGDQALVDLVPGRLERGLQVRDHGRPELLVRLGAGDDLVHLAPGPRELLGRLDPAFRGRRQNAQELRQPLFVVCAEIPSSIP